MNMSNILTALGAAGIEISGTHRITDKELLTTREGRLYADNRRRLLGIVADGVRLPVFGDYSDRKADITIRPPQGEAERALFTAEAVKMLTEMLKPNGGSWVPEDSAKWAEYRATIASLTA